MSSPRRSNKKFSALIVGLGNIGFGYDEDQPRYVFTHSRAYLKNKQIDLIAGIDPREARRRAFSRKTKTRAYGSIAEFNRFEKEGIDIVSICTPTETHYRSVKECLGMKPRIIVLEKPISNDIDEARAIVKLCREKKVALYVNYMRRVDPFFAAAKKTIQQKKLGELLFGAVYYSGGLNNNASHFIDLLNFWLGDSFEKVNYRDNGTFGLQYGARQFHFQTSGGFNYALTECDLVFSRGRIRCLDSDLSYEIHESRGDRYFKNYRALKKTESGPIPSLLRYQVRVVEHILDYLKRGTKLRSTGDTALKTLEIIEKVKRA